MVLSLDKVRKTAKILRAIMDVFFWVTIISGMGIVSLCILVLIGALTIPKTESMTISLVLNGLISYKVDRSMYELPILRPVILRFIPTVSLVVLMAATIFRQVRNILKTVVQDCPFAEENVKRLFIIAFSLITGSVLINVAQYLLVVAAVQSLQINCLQVSYATDLTMLTTGLLILILAGVFKYGCFLQKEYDATL
ncbi:MAG: DUF2975 domain-containing protein [Firmicutes bacterium]|nr:DUF2975 domain-containing protein [Bacillota bacterium]